MVLFNFVIKGGYLTKAVVIEASSIEDAIATYILSDDADKLRVFLLIHACRKTNDNISTGTIGMLHDLSVKISKNMKSTHITADEYKKFVCENVDEIARMVTLASTQLPEKFYIGEVDIETQITKSSVKQ